MADDREAGVESAGAAPGPRVETAVTPIIRAEPIHIPTPAWGALSASDTEVIEAELVETGALPLSEGDTEGDAEPVLPRSPWLGWFAFLIAVGTVVVHGVAVAVDAGKDYELSTVLAWVAIGLSIVAVVVGVVAAAFGRGRGPGIAAAIVGVLANPWLLLHTLRLLGG